MSFGCEVSVLMLGCRAGTLSGWGMGLGEGGRVEKGLAWSGASSIQPAQARGSPTLKERENKVRKKNRLELKSLKTLTLIFLVVIHYECVKKCLVFCESIK